MLCVTTVSCSFIILVHNNNRSLAEIPGQKTFNILHLFGYYLSICHYYWISVSISLTTKHRDWIKETFSQIKHLFFCLSYWTVHVKALQLKLFWGSVICLTTTICVPLGTEKLWAVAYQKTGSSLEQVIGVQDPLIVCTQMGANSLAWSIAHFDRYLSPAPLSADCIKSSFFIHQLEKETTLY